MDKDWIYKIDKEKFTNSFPIADIAENSVYYPACGVDTNLIRHFVNTRQSFIYCDYVLGRYIHRPIKDYELLYSRPVALSELIGHYPWSRQVSQLSDEARRNYWYYIEYRHSRFNSMDLWAFFKEKAIVWSIYEHKLTKKRYSLLLVSNDGVGTYYAIYHIHKKHATCVAAIQDGSAFGGNWSSFRRDPFLKSAVTENPAGVPQYVIYGGTGTGYDRDDIWDDYSYDSTISSYYMNSASRNEWSKEDNFGEVNIFKLK